MSVSRVSGDEARGGILNEGKCIVLRKSLEDGLTEWTLEVVESRLDGNFQCPSSTIPSCRTTLAPLTMMLDWSSVASLVRGVWGPSKLESKPELELALPEEL